MDYEQKYKEILEWARKNKARLNGVPIEDVLPELAESDDERIRKGLIEALKTSKTVGELKFILPEPTREEGIAYLEKQKESLHISETCKENANSFTDEDERIRKQLIDAIKIGCSNSGISFTEEAASRYTAWLEKHSEEEIKKIRKEEYTNGFNDAAGFGKQKEQKPADLSKMMVHKEPYIAPVPTPMVADEQKAVSYSPLCNTIKDKIREYVANNFVTDTVVKTDVKSIVKAMEEGVRLGKEEQKPAEWSKNDTVFLNEIIDYFENKTVRLQHDIDMYAHWLKSLPERFNLQPKEEWSEEDEEMMGCIIDDIREAKRNSDKEYFKELCDKEIAWLKSLRPSWKPSENEERLINTSISFLKDFADKGYENAVECIDWLKSKLNGNTCK